MVGCKCLGHGFTSHTSLMAASHQASQKSILRSSDRNKSLQNMSQQYNPGNLSLSDNSYMVTSLSVIVQLCMQFTVRYFCIIYDTQNNFLKSNSNKDTNGFIIVIGMGIIPFFNLSFQQDPTMVEQLSKNITRQGLTNYTLNFLRVSVRV